MQCLRFYIQRNDPDKVKNIFLSARNNLGSNGSEIWLIYIIYVKTSPPDPQNKEFGNLVTELSQITYPQFNVLKAKILELVATTQSIKHARKAYQMFIRNYAGCLEVHETMADLESKQVGGFNVLYN